MEVDTALKLVDNAVFNKLGRHLSGPEETILRGTWEGMTYEQMAENSQYSLNYLMRDIGPKFWRILSVALAENITKTNLRTVLARQFKSGLGNLSVAASWGAAPTATLVKEVDPFVISRDIANWRRKKEPKNNFKQPEETVAVDHAPDWNEAPSLSNLYGREQELEQLKNWLKDGNTNLITIQGLVGSGKTALARQIAEEMQEEFDVVVWRSLNRMPSLTELLVKLLRKLSPSSFGTQNDLISYLIDAMREYRCLIILDGLEDILQPGQLSGTYQPNYQEYAELFRRVGQESHQSCMIVTTLENPKEVSFLAGEQAKVKTLPLTGIDVDAAQTMLQQEGLEINPSGAALINRYQGNPSALKLIARIIRELFHGNVAEFLAHEALVFGDISKLIDKAWQRLSPLEQEILNWLVIEGKPMTLGEIQQDLTLNVSQGELLEALISIRHRGLIASETAEGKSLFSLPTIVTEYVANHLIGQISGENSGITSTEESIELSLSNSNPAFVNLSKWSRHNFEAGWQPLESLFTSPAKILPSLRSTYPLRGDDTIKRCKYFRLNKGSETAELALLVAINNDSRNKYNIRVQIHPWGDAMHLPDSVSLSLLNEAGQVLRTVTSNAQDNCIQLPLFRGETGEKFSVQINWGESTMQEDFSI
ncbi:MAG: DUF1822 family protein [Cyanobacteria bacterium J083]|nr:MAG: DUF1822 family protein [Cyanobacteria bacterium J083]